MTKKINRVFVLGDSTLNSFGFRLLTSGYQINEYLKNPVGYYMHERESGVVVRWEDLKVDGDKIIGRPVINLTHPRGQQTVDEIENGFLNAASFGHFVILESSDDPTLKVSGQTGPTITKWYNRECSLVDVPGNFNSLGLYDSKGNEIKDLKLFALQASPSIPTTATQQIKTTIVDLQKMIVGAVADNDLTEDEAIKLKKHLEEDPYCRNKDDVQIVLDNVANNRVSYLMSLDFEEIDKNNKLSEEFQRKFLLGLLYKQLIAFNVKENGEANVKAFIKFGKDVGLMDSSQIEMAEAWMYKEPEKVKGWFDKHVESFVRYAKRPLSLMTVDEKKWLSKYCFYAFKRISIKAVGFVQTF